MGSLPDAIEILKMRAKTGAILSAHIFSIRPDMLSGPTALSAPNFLILSRTMSELNDIMQIF